MNALYTPEVTDELGFFPVKRKRLLKSRTSKKQLALIQKRSEAKKIMWEYFKSYKDRYVKKLLNREMIIQRLMAGENPMVVFQPYES